MSERLLQALITHMIRTGTLDRDDITAMADRLDDDDDPEAAHVMRCMILHAEAPSASSWRASRTIERLKEKLLRPDGGNDTS